jgi:PAS domain S-box-containing protein
MYLKDLEGRYLTVNPETARMCGLPAEAMLGRDAAAVLPPRRPAGPPSRLEVLERGEPTRHEERHAGVPPQVGRAWGMVIRFPVRDGRGRSSRSAASTST